MIEQYKLRILINNIEEDMLNIIILEKDYNLINSYLSDLIKSFEIYNLRLCSLSKKKLSNIVKKNLGSFNLLTLILFFSSYFRDYILANNTDIESEISTNLNNKFLKLKLERKSTFDNFMENISDNNILYYHIEYLKKTGDEISWNCFKEILEKRISHLDLNETVSILIFLIETKILELDIFDKLYKHLNSLIEKNSKKNFDLIFNKLCNEKDLEKVLEKTNALKILLIFNKIQISENFENFFLNLSIYIDNYNKNKETSISNENCFILDNQENNDFSNLNKDFEKIAKNNIIINSKKLNNMDIQNKTDYLKNFIEFFKRNNQIIGYGKNKKNPFDFLIINYFILSDENVFKCIDDKSIKHLKNIYLEVFDICKENISWRLFFLINISNLKFICNLIKCQENDKQFSIFKQKILLELRSITFNKFHDDYLYLKNYVTHLSNSNLINSLVEREIKYFFNTLYENFIYIHSIDAKNEDYLKLNKLILQDLIIFSYFYSYFFPKSVLLSRYVEYL